MDINQWKSHIDTIVDDEGQWIGIADENGYPLYELHGQLKFPQAQLSASSAEMTVHVHPQDPILNDLVGNNLGATDKEGRLLPIAGPTRLLILTRGNTRRAALITHVIVGGTSTPSTVTIHAVDLLDGLASWPAPSIPVEWIHARNNWKQLSADESHTDYGQVYEVARVPFATKLLMYREEGPAKTVIRNIIQDSFDAVNALMGWGRPHAVVAYDGGKDTTAHVQMRINDDPVLDTVAETARQCGLAITVELWWPGDAAVTVRTDQEGTKTREQTWSHPIQIVRVEEFKEEP